MKAIVFHEQGDASKLSHETYPDPILKRSDEIIVRVRSCAINRLDLNARSYRPEITNFPHILGSDIAGEIAEIGKNVTNVKIGDRVILSPNIPCDRCFDCLNGDENLCGHQKLIGFQINGGYAEFVKVPAKNAIRIADEISFANASAVPIAYLTAWHMLVTRAKLCAGEDILILSIGGGVGSAGLQIAKLCGARIFATSSSDRKLEIARKMGADFAIDYTKTDFSEATRELTNGRGVDVVFEHVGSATWEQSIKCLAKNGRLVTCGVTTGNIGEIDIRKMYQKQLTLIGSALGTTKELRRVIELLNRKKLSPIIDQILPLEKARQAHKRLESRQVFGKICLEI